MMVISQWSSNDMENAVVQLRADRGIETNETKMWFNATNTDKLNTDKHSLFSDQNINMFLCSLSS